jgi:exopolysaccharide production protein ExoZ
MPAGPTSKSAPHEARPRLHNIQYLRAAAALGVVAFHAGISAGVSLDFGALGVDIFFVISGFLMVVITDEGTRTWPFLRERFLRVAPLYWCATIATILCFGIAWPGAKLAASFLFLPWGPAREAPWFFPVLNVGWTLNFEMFFYLLFGISLFAPRRWRLAALAALFLGAALLGLTRLGASLPWSFWGHPIIFEFLAGAALAAAWRSKGRWGLALGFVGIASAAILVSRVTAYPIRTSALTVAAALVTAAVLLERKRRPVRLLLVLGDASYSIYLWHYLAIVAAATPFVGPEVASNVRLLLFIAVGTGAGLAAHFVLERPLLAILRARYWKRNAPVPAGV